GAGHVLPYPHRGGDRGCEIRPGLVRELGTRLGRVWKSLCRSRDYGRVLLDDHDGPFQGARPGARLAKRDHQVVAAHALNEGSSLRVVEVSKYFAAPDDSAPRTHALNGVSLSVAAGELV